MQAFLDILQAIGIITQWLVIGAGLWWFFRRRQTFPKATYSHLVEHWPISGQHTYMRVTLSIENKGNVVLRIASGCVRIYRVLPWPHPELVARLARGEPYLNPNENEIDWPLIDGHDLYVPTGTIEIEPGETDEIPFDFVVSGDDKLVLIYSYLANDRKKHIGWSKSNIVSLTSKESINMTYKRNNQNNQLIQTPNDKTQQGQKPVEQKPTRIPTSHPSKSGGK